MRENALKSCAALLCPGLSIMVLASGPRLSLVPLCATQPRSPILISTTYSQTSFSFSQQAPPCASPEVARAFPRGSRGARGLPHLPPLL